MAGAYIEKLEGFSWVKGSKGKQHGDPIHKASRVNVDETLIYYSCAYSFLQHSKGKVCRYALLDPI